MILLAQSAVALTGHVPLLAVSERGSAREGKIADLFLEIREGTGRVFLDTAPLTKITTQASMRFAQQMACRELDIDCSSKDFIYTIRAPPGIVTGPSAGATATALTAILLKGLELNESVALTGTINSGGIIGPVGGLQEKIAAAAEGSISIVLIPQGTRMQNKNNKTIDLVDYGAEQGVTVQEVSTIDQALQHFNGDITLEQNPSFSIRPGYTLLMHDIVEELCGRSAALMEGLSAQDIGEDQLNLTLHAQKAREAGRDYAASSFCFRANVDLREIMLTARNMTRSEVEDELESIEQGLAAAEETLAAHPIDTITDLQTYMAVNERLEEVGESINTSQGRFNATHDAIATIAYLQERLASAQAWSLFFHEGNRKFVVDTERLRNSCVSKIAEAEERMDYVRSYLPEALVATNHMMSRAYDDMQNDNFIGCLHKASKAKAEANVILNLMGVEDDRVPELITLKLDIVRRAMAKAQQKGIFPLIGYAYYEYASSLRETDEGSAMLFAEYALEFSTLDIYFEQKHEMYRWDDVSTGYLTSFLLGVIMCLIFNAMRSRPCKRERKRKTHAGSLRPLRGKKR